MLSAFTEKINNFISRFGISGSVLKIIAVVIMIIDHTGLILLRPGTTAYILLRAIGRIAFPIFAFLVAEGMARTKNLTKYGLRLFLFAVASEIPFNYVVYGQVLHFENRNVFFTLFFAVSVYAVWFYSTGRWKYINTAIIFAAVMLLAWRVSCDYSWRGVLLVLVFFIFRKLGAWRVIPAVIYMIIAWHSAYLQMYMLLAAPIIFMYNGTRGFIKSRGLKLAFYAVYPVHFVILYGIGFLINP